MEIMVLVITHNSGIDHTAYDNEDAVKEHLTQWARDWWLDEKLPERLVAIGEKDPRIINGECDDVQVRAAYWGVMKDHGESYEILNLPVHSKNAYI